MPKASPPVALLAMHGHTGTEVARAAGRSVSNTSQVISGWLDWNPIIEDALLEVTGDEKLVTEIKGMARQRHLERRAAKAADRKASQNAEVGS